MPPAAQRAFLARQVVTFLPLDPDALLQLRHLGIRTLGQFANLPTVGVLARFGVVGRTAQRWAQGLDDRPVIPSWEKPELSTRLEFEPPLAERDRLLAALMQRAEQLLLSLRKEFQVVGRVRLIATRADGRVIAGGHIFPQPTAVLGTVRYGMTAALDRLAWDRQPAAEITLTFSDIRDQPVQQWTLFDAGLWSTEEGVTNQDRAALQTILEQLTARYSADAFRMVTLPNPDHPLPERRVSWRPFGA